MEAPISDSERLCADELLRREIELASGTLSWPSTAALPEVDLRTLLAEMTALKAEVRAETRAARDVRERLDKSSGLLHEQLERQGRRELQLQEALQDAEHAATRRAAGALIDIADRLEASLRQPPARGRRWYWPLRARVHRALEAVHDGLRLTLNRVHDHLAEAGVERVLATGQPFDASLMEAIDTVSLPHVAERTVVEEVTGGYRLRRGGGMLRRAQVIVNRHGC